MVKSSLGFFLILLGFEYYSKTFLETQVILIIFLNINDTERCNDCNDFFSWSLKPNQLLKPYLLKGDQESLLCKITCDWTYNQEPICFNLVAGPYLPTAQGLLIHWPVNSC